MRFLNCTIGAAATLFAFSVSAESPEAKFDLHAEVSTAAFDPDKYFQGDNWSEPLLTIRYLGDDWDFPVYSIALWDGCHDDDPDGDKSCVDRISARMVRSPWPDGEPDRPRWRGSKLLGELARAGADTKEELFTQLDNQAVEWMEADVASCPKAQTVAASFNDLNWVNEPLIPEQKDEDVIHIVLHADTIELRYRPYHYDIQFSGLIEEKQPSSWAVEFAQALEDCWQPSKATTPWRRIAKSDDDQEE